MGRSAVEAFDPQRLREARERAGLTQRDIAVRLLEADLAAKGRDPSSLTGEAWAKAVETERIRVIDYEQGTHAPRAVLLRRLAEALGVDAFELFAEGTPRTLVTLRSRLGLNQADVAAHLTVGRAFYARVEQGRASMRNAADQQALAAVLKISIDEVRTLTSATTPPDA
ncbi:helix-turn-helix transcriptional regulator [Catenuloplanes atrovinosus]|uniref:Transcriptional regulator with XRE-family HTH domain n=1 Tax=Catenuloplanes atrovinosus TaxID=137266 RepID=A0AAE4CAH9_9ACTN|nr:helix-turn-helix domain-containing protein [Catenuloplanes atrovinosus]MDR7277616.1 transcriptional regulator with XRE-family HTH domain [Catenuloplanes atrovinosus]